MNRTAVSSLVALLGGLIFSPPAAAHRLDEYLQATRVAIDIDRIELEIDLTPGVSVAPQVLSVVDGNGDGEISGDESRSYAQRVMGSIVLSVDDRPVPLTLADYRFPPLHELRVGVGTIRLSAVARVSASAGLHRISYFNAFAPELSVYLANALVPSNDRIGITEQGRDSLQHGLTVEYRVGAAQANRVGWSIAGLGVLGALAGSIQALGARVLGRRAATA